MNEVPRKSLLRRVSVPALAFVLGAIVSYTIPHHPSQKEPFALREHNEQYAFIQPVLICQTNEQEQSSELKNLRQEIEGIITNSVERGFAERGSVYFRDLNAGRWMGVREEDTYSPASLLKVPIMIALYKESEQNASILEKTYPYIAGTSVLDEFIDQPKLKVGRSYRVDELIDAMITQSDNNAKDMLRSVVDPSVLEDVYHELGITDPYSFSNETYALSAKQYGLFFRVLYNATFLSREKSDAALALLSRSQFDKGLRAGVPPLVNVAHKYGVRVTPQKVGEKIELSDCGIVYPASFPYLLCVMLEGNDAYTLADVIKKISEAVYQYESNVGE